MTEKKIKLDDLSIILEVVYDFLLNFCFGRNNKKRVKALHLFDFKGKI